MSNSLLDQLDNIRWFYTYECLVTDALELTLTCCTIAYLTINYFRKGSVLPAIAIVQLALLFIQTALYNIKDVWEVTNEIDENPELDDWVLACTLSGNVAFMF